MAALLPLITSTSVVDDGYYRLARADPPDQPRPYVTAAPRPTIRPTPVPVPRQEPLHQVSPVSGTATFFSGATGAYGPLVGMYAAVRTCPHGGCVLRVTNVSPPRRCAAAYRGREVTVTVRDYGPAEWTGHLIDLAPAAFAAIAPLGCGIVDVAVTSL